MTHFGLTEWPQYLTEWLASGFVATLGLWIVTSVATILFALPVAAMRSSRVWPLRMVAIAYIELFRGTPLLVQLFIIFYGLPKLGIVLDAFPAALIGFILCIGAYTSETIRAAISSIPKGQWEASFSIGMTWSQSMRRTILPQAASVATPSLANTFISLVKDTSLAASLTVPELFQQAQVIAAVNYEPLIVYIEAAIIYLLFSSVLSNLQARLEKRLGRHVSTAEAA